ncbi:MAG: hypothetical protein WB760_04060 [Xanthobacteraceae bacterium]
MDEWSLGRKLFVLLLVVGIVFVVSGKQASQVNAPIASASSPLPLGMIADDTGQWAGTIRINTLKFDLFGRSSATVCHQSENGPSCHRWTFDCRNMTIWAALADGYRPPAYDVHDERLLTKQQFAEIAAFDAVSRKLPATACTLPDRLFLIRDKAAAQNQ